ncbi:uroporphyrinogen-III synthase [Virgibacillus sp. C22-A2]|uniref:Uroporphyrinogen-III synthase n=1 Tax=Virgibacillus tibetensis TaxID=3042313 RepID=A0ABU6KC41_9BACI|nr:uroporphyrinogen-III synthase [Virgibacillus sp. C22-A2]
MPISLHEKKILITREESQAKEFTEMVRFYGGQPVEVPLLTISCKDKPESKQLLTNLNKYEWLFFTSANGVNCFFQLVKKYKIDWAVFQTMKMAVVGHKTEAALKGFGFTASFMPTTYNADVMANEFLNRETGKIPVLLVRGNRSREVLPARFSKYGLPYDLLEVYDTSYNYQMKHRLNDILKNGNIDYITFTSPSTVEAFWEMATAESRIPCACIGTTTELRARELGFNSVITPQEFTIDELIASLSNYITERG